MRPEYDSQIILDLGNVILDLKGERRGSAYMGEFIKQMPVKLIMSIIFKDDDLLETIEYKLTGLFGDIEDLSYSGSFDFTDYYKPEFGEKLRRKIIVFKELVDLEDIYKTKIRTNEIEDSTKINGKRRINLDPGYVTEGKLVLFTTKDHAHRIYLRRKVFAENTLYYEDKSFRSRPWTYPDYASKELVQYFNYVREVYRKDINKT